MSQNLDDLINSIDNPTTNRKGPTMKTPRTRKGTGSAADVDRPVVEKVTAQGTKPKPVKKPRQARPVAAERRRTASSVKEVTPPISEDIPVVVISETVQTPAMTTEEPSAATVKEETVIKPEFVEPPVQSTPKPEEVKEAPSHIEPMKFKYEENIFAQQYDRSWTDVGLDFLRLFGKVTMQAPRPFPGWVFLMDEDRKSMEHKFQLVNFMNHIANHTGTDKAKTLSDGMKEVTITISGEKVNFVMFNDPYNGELNLRIFANANSSVGKGICSVSKKELAQSLTPQVFAKTMAAVAYEYLLQELDAIKAAA